MRNVTRWTVMWAAAMATLSAAPAGAVTAALCVKATLKGPIKMRADSPCKPTEIQLGSFDGTTIQLSGVNLQIVSGSGTTNGAVNGTGNLLVGYNEGKCAEGNICTSDADCAPHVCMGGTICEDLITPCTTDAECSVCSHADKTGSHNLVVGPGHTYPNKGGFVAGYINSVTGENASVCGGVHNEASGPSSSVSGGVNNEASNDGASVSGGSENVASGPNASVSGGLQNTASDNGSSVSGGVGNSAQDYADSVSGGAGVVVNSGDPGWAAGSSGSTAGPGAFFSY